MINSESYHHVKTSEFPYVQCRSPDRCDYKLVKNLYAGEHNAYWKVEATAGSELAKFLDDTLKTRTLNARMVTHRDAPHFMTLQTTFTTARQVCCHDHLMVPASVLTQNFRANWCTQQDHGNEKTASACGTPVYLNELGEGGAVSKRLTDPKMLEAFGANPSTKPSRPRMIRVMITQLMMALKHCADKKLVLRRFGWGLVFASTSGAPMIKLKLPPESLHFNTIVRTLLYNRADGKAFDPGHFPIKDADKSKGVVTPELNPRHLVPYMIDKFAADNVVKIVNKKEASEGKTYKEVDDDEQQELGFDEGELIENLTPPYHYNAPDVWQAGIMLLQLIFKDSNHPLVRELSNDDTIGGCASRIMRPFARDMRIMQNNIDHLRQSMDYILYQTIHFEALAPAVDWSLLKSHPIGKHYLELIQRMMNCDYRARFTPAEALVYLVETLPATPRTGGTVLPEGMLLPETPLAPGSGGDDDGGEDGLGDYAGAGTPGQAPARVVETRKARR